MTPIDKVFMLSIDSRLDYETLKRICDTGHSRVPVYEEIEVPVMTKSQLAQEIQQGVAPSGAPSSGTNAPPGPTQKVKKIVGILLVKQCILLDAKGKIPPTTACITLLLIELVICAFRRYSVAEYYVESDTLRSERRTAPTYTRQISGRPLAHGDSLSL